jgi:hypothetical protein
MKIAFLICGQPRFTNDFNNLLANLKGYDTADWFCYFTGDNQNIPSDKLPSKFWSKITDTNQALTHYQSSLPSNNFVRSFELSDSDYIELPQVPAGIPTPGYKLWYNLFKVNQLRKNYATQNNINYDLVIRVRPDIGLVNEINLKDINIQYLENSILAPKNKIAGHWYYSASAPRMCDMFAISIPKVMDIYCDMFLTAANNFFTQTLATWNTESAHALHLRNNNIFVTPGNFKISIRGDSN